MLYDNAEFCTALLCTTASGSALADASADVTLLLAPLGLAASYALRSCLVGFTISCGEGPRS